MSTKISNLPEAAALVGVEATPLVQAGATVQTPYSSLRAFAMRTQKRALLQKSILGVMATPPTIAYGAQGAVSSLNGNAAYVNTYPILANPGIDGSAVNTNGPFRWSAFPAIGGTGFPNTFYAQADKTYETSPFGEPPYVIEFDLYGDAFEISVKGLTGINFQMFVDDQPIALDPTVPTALEIPGDGFNYRILFTFPDASIYRIRIESGIATHFGGIDLAPGYDIGFPSAPGKLRRCVFFGDSYVSGSTDPALGYPGPDAFGFECSRVLGWDPLISGYGGTGYIIAPTFQSRVASDVIALNPDVVVVLGGLNDQDTQTPEDIAAAAQTLYETIRAGLPDADLYVCGIESPSGSNITNTPINEALAAVCAGFSPPIPFISVIEAYALAYTLICSDNTHPTPEGYRWLGRWVGSRIQNVLDTP